MSTEQKQITYPRRYYVRRAELVYWLEGFEYKPGRCYTAKVVRRFIEAGTIPKHRMRWCKLQVRFVPREVAVALQLSAPLV